MTTDIAKLREMVREARIESVTPGWGPSVGLVRDLADAIDSLLDEAVDGRLSSVILR